MITKEYVDESEERIINDDYKNWKKSVPFLYDIVMNHALHWPSFTFEWLPGVIKNGSLLKSQILLGSTTDSDKNHILLADVYLPNEDELIPEIPFGAYKLGLGRIGLKKRIIHKNAVTKARHMPQKPNIIAATSNSSIQLYDIENKSYNINEEELEDFANIPDVFSKPLLYLSGFNTFNGALSWNLNETGCILASGGNKSIGFWDLCSQNVTDNCQNATTIFTGHTGHISSVSWWPTLPTVFLSSSDDCNIGIWDIRSRNHSSPSHSICGHKMPITSVSASPFSHFLFASTSEDSTLALWDVRNLTLKLHSLSNKANDVMSNVQWSPHSPNFLACNTMSRTVAIWDLGMLHDPENFQSAIPDDPPELLFLHGGHSATIGDFGWHPEIKNMIGSTANDNIIQIWKPIESLFSSATNPQLLQPEISSNQVSKNEETVL